MLVVGAAPAARAQLGRGGPRPPSSQPKQEPKGPTPEEQEELHNAYQRAAEPEIAPPSSPLTVSPEVEARLGTDYASGPASPEGTLQRRKWLPYYEETRGDYRLRLAPPFWLEHTRGLTDPTQALYGIPKTPDTEGLIALLYYYRRSRDLDMDVVFPAFWHVRDRENHVAVVGPVAHREAPGENDNWVAPLFFQGSRKDGGYFHSLPLLTTSHWGEKGAFTLVGPYFRDRTGPTWTLASCPSSFTATTGASTATGARTRSCRRYSSITRCTSSTRVIRP
jgi:hypothetical protein